LFLSYCAELLIYIAEPEVCPEASHPTINGLVRISRAVAHVHPSP